ncbi:FAD-binding oxidoreductase [Deinococcus peraridilitoris]|uniref:D-lactate dehydrogenase (cytochrome) n=1 Tax=Deinococcus peraridilitoris (strain DSM 19664 / LMG 22246 / CIP 109416 / KR-200) TaxID=937777 RepID=L0A6H1_DEIPD|nr:FAD-binding oxidoreductase [Deinococcus peraridilitoris]AFZ69483.1 FAD/FMN-dependent dehydrogenase [Deinococcus peraridilitoris DSM 19664]
MTTVPTDDAFAELHSRLGAKLSRAPGDLNAHGYDEGGSLQHYPPHAVVFAENEQDVVDTLAFAARHGVPVTPWAAGSGLEGNALPVRGGISLDVTRMNRVLRLDPDNFSATVEPGVLYPELSRLARPHGLFFAVDPGAEASLGGMAATGASGTGAVRYGTMRDNVLEMRVALTDGRVIRVGSRARKSSAGYDLKNLFVGSEGTLGVITQLTVKLHPLPATLASLRASFPTVESAVQAAVLVMGAGVRPERLELVDANTVQAVNAYKNTRYDETPTLWIELSGRDETDLQTQLNLVMDLCGETDGYGFERATTEGERLALWTARHHAYYAIRALFPGHRIQSTDVCVPIAELPGAIRETQRLLDAHDIHGPILGHVGDGNYHVSLHAPGDDTAAWARTQEVLKGMVAYAHGVGGTCTGEHAVGLNKRKYMRAEHGEALDVMRSIKQLLDPQGILNPGKIFPDE